MHRITLLPSSSLPNPVLSVSYHFLSRTNTQGVIIHGYTVTIISNGTHHSLDPLLSIHLLKHCNCRPVACVFSFFPFFFFFANLLREVIEAHIHSCFKTGFTLPVISRGVESLRCPTITTMAKSARRRSACVKGKDHEDTSKAIYTFQSQTNVAKNHDEREEREHAKWERKEKGWERIGARQWQRN